MTPALPRCKACRSPLELRQTCLNIFWYCLACGGKHEIEEYPEYIDDALEERLANVYCNRI